jgi:hypothetical protein
VRDAEYRAAQWLENKGPVARALRHNPFVLVDNMPESTG